VKGGKDYSTISNRIGEAEKSLRKARSGGYPESWTVVIIDRVDLEMEKKTSRQASTGFSGFQGCLTYQATSFRLSGISSCLASEYNDRAFVSDIKLFRVLIIIRIYKFIAIKIMMTDIFKLRIYLGKQ
jgi:hypothetical protein